MMYGKSFLAFICGCMLAIACLSVSGCSVQRSGDYPFDDEDMDLEDMKPEDYTSDGFTTRKRDRSASPSSRVVTDNNTFLYTNILDYLDGRVAGVYVENGRAYIRGNQEEALYVVDGVEVNDISFVNPNDVRTIDVLKGPEASIYGLRGVNGVIVIKTKGAGDSNKGKKGRNVEVNVSTGISPRSR